MCRFLDKDGHCAFHSDDEVKEYCVAGPCTDMQTYNELIEALRYCSDEDKICTREQNCGYYGKGFFCQDVLMCDAADALEAAEKRIAELEAQMPKEGEWMPVGDGTIYVKCSVCGEEMCCRGHYCPNCGARMDGERKDGERRTDETEGS